MADEIPPKGNIPDDAEFKGNSFAPDAQANPYTFENPVSPRDFYRKLLLAEGGQVASFSPAEGASGATAQTQEERREKEYARANLALISQINAQITANNQEIAYLKAENVELFKSLTHTNAQLKKAEVELESLQIERKTAKIQLDDLDAEIQKGQNRLKALEILAGKQDRNTGRAWDELAKYSLPEKIVQIPHTYEKDGTCAADFPMVAVFEENGKYFYYHPTSEDGEKQEVNNPDQIKEIEKQLTEGKITADHATGTDLQKIEKYKELVRDAVLQSEAGRKTWEVYSTEKETLDKKFKEYGEKKAYIEKLGKDIKLKEAEIADFKLTKDFLEEKIHSNNGRITELNKDNAINAIKIKAIAAGKTEEEASKIAELYWQRDQLITEKEKASFAFSNTYTQEYVDELNLQLDGVEKAGKSYKEHADQILIDEAKLRLLNMMGESKAVTRAQIDEILKYAPPDVDIKTKLQEWITQENITVVETGGPSENISPFQTNSSPNMCPAPTSSLTDSFTPAASPPLTETNMSSGEMPAPVVTPPPKNIPASR